MLGAEFTYIDPVPFLGDGASIGIGGDASDPYWGQQEMVSGPPSVIHTIAPAYPYFMRHMEYASIPLYPDADRSQGSEMVLQAPQAPAGSLAYPGQDQVTPYVGAGMDVVLGSPTVPTGDANFF